MAVEQLTFRMTPDPLEFFDGIQAIKQQLRDFRQPWKQLLPVLGSEMARTIREEGAPIGAPKWAPHSPATIARYGAGQHAKLQHKHRLLRAVYKGGKRALTANLLRYGPSKRYHFVMQFGSDRRKIPARQYVGLTEPMTAAANALMDQHVARILAQASARISSRGGSGL